jgi:two-component system LytT family response regulator
LLNMHPFYRVYQSYLVYLVYVQKYVRSDGGYLVLPGNIPISIANSHKEGLIRKLQNLSL